MSDRDYLAEFEAYLAEHVPGGDFIAPVLAGEMVQHLRQIDPDLLRGWLDARAAVILADFIGTRDRVLRARAARERPAGNFAKAAARFAAGDTAAMEIFTQRLVVNDDNLRRPIGDMTKPDHLFVADQHVMRSEAALFEAAFHRAVAKKIPAGKTTADVMSEADYLKMRDSVRLGKRSAA